MHIVSRWIWPSLHFELLVAKKVMVLFEKCKQDDSMCERGGQLFVDMSYSNGLVIAFASEPHQSDIATPTSLLLDPERCREEVRAFNRNSLLLAGYWHTHSEEDPQLSRQDLKSFHKFRKDNQKALPFPLAVIVGQLKINIWSIRVQPVAGYVAGSVSEHIF